MGEIQSLVFRYCVPFRTLSPSLSAGNMTQTSCLIARKRIVNDMPRGSTPSPSSHTLKMPSLDSDITKVTPSPSNAHNGPPNRVSHPLLGRLIQVCAILCLSVIAGATANAENVMPRIQSPRDYWQAYQSLSEVHHFVDLAYNRTGDPDKLRILAQSSEDIELLATGPWLTPFKLAFLGFISLLAFMGAGLWSFTLRRRIQQQTMQITRQVERETALQNQHRAIIDSVHDFIYTVDTNGRFRSFNNAGQTITGYSLEEFSSLSLQDLICEESGNRTEFGLDEENLNPHVTFETQIRRKDGQQAWVEITAGFVQQEGQPLCGYGVMRNIDSRKKIELELKQARDAAEASSKAKNTFLATMSHELRTPMNGVIGMTELLLGSQLDESSREFAESIRDSANSLLCLLNDLLDMSKAEAGKLTIDPHPFNLQNCLQQPITLLDATANAKGIKLHLEHPDNLPVNSIGDAGRLRQVLLNLIGNAIKFTDEGSVTLRVDLLDETKNDIGLRFQVTDTGIGIPEEVQAKLFEPFEQGDASLSRKYGGTGLGLNISRAIIERMGGKIGLKSETGKGSTFWFNIRLPRFEGSLSDSLALQKAEKKTGLKWRGKKLSVLVVEDTPINQRVTRLQLKKMGIETDLAADGYQAVEAVKQKHYDVIFMDCQMPGMDGLDATRHIRKNPSNDDIHIVALTASAMQGDRENCLAAGMDDYISKPTRPDKLLAALERYAQRQEAVA